MEPDADLAAMGRLIGDQNRARMLQVLLSGTPQSGSSLASAAGISRSLASAHLKKLTAGGLVRAERHGRQQLYSIAGEQVAASTSRPYRTAPGRCCAPAWTGPSGGTTSRAASAPRSPPSLPGAAGHTAWTAAGSSP